MGMRQMMLNIHYKTDLTLTAVPNTETAVAQLTTVLQEPITNGN